MAQKSVHEIAQTFPGETLIEYHAELMVEVLIDDNEDVLAGFPYAEGQYQGRKCHSASGSAVSR